MNHEAASSGSMMQPEMSNSTAHDEDMMKDAPGPDGVPSMKEMPASGGHMMAADDPDNPQNWPLHEKVYASAVAYAFAWVV